MKKKLALSLLSSMVIVTSGMTASAAEPETEAAVTSESSLEARIEALEKKLALAEKANEEMRAKQEKLETKKDKPDPVKLSGVFANKAMKGTGNGANDPHTWWEKELFLNIDGTMGNTGWNAHAGLDWKWGTDTNGWNGERTFADRYGNDDRDVNAMIYQLYAKGPVAKNTNATIGLFTPALQNGVVGDARVIGIEVDYQMNDTTFRAYKGKVNEKNADMSSDWSDGFVRNGNRYDYSNSGAPGYDNNRSLKVWGLAAEHKFTDKTSAGIGYYNYSSANAYLEDKLSIAAVNANHKLMDNLELSGFYSRGNRHHQNKAYDLKLSYNGSPWDGKQWGASLGYRYLGSDALIKSSITHGSEKPGNKGVEAGIWYRFNSNIVMENYLFFGKAIDSEQHHGQHHTAYFSNLMFCF